MSKQSVQVTVSLPKEIYERIERVAVDEKRQIEDLLNSLIVQGIDLHSTVRELFEHASKQYRDRLESEGKLNQSSDEVLEELRNLREKMASELYP